MPLFRCGGSTRVTALTITGTLEVGATLGATPTPAGATGTYQWYRGGTAISGATSSAYTLVSADRTNLIKCVFIANGSYSGTVEDTTAEAIYGWVTVTRTITINSTTSRQTYTFDAPIRNFKIKWSIKGQWSSTGGSGSTTLQCGLSLENTELPGWNATNWFSSGGSGNWSWNSNATISNNVAYDSLVSSPWTAVWGSRTGYNSWVATSSIQLTQWEETRLLY